MVTMNNTESGLLSQKDPSGYTYSNKNLTMMLTHLREYLAASKLDTPIGRGGHGQGYSALPNLRMQPGLFFQVEVNNPKNSWRPSRKIVLSNSNQGTPHDRYIVR